MEWKIKSTDELNKHLQFCDFDEEKLNRQATIHKALADSTRLKIVKLLTFSNMCLCEISEVLKIPNSTLNHHLRLLKEGGIINSTRIGRKTVFQLIQKEVDTSV